MAGVAWVARELAGAKTATQENVVVVRTATITTGDLERTIRVSGVVQAERFAALMAPRLRGSRGASGSFGGGGTKSLVTSGSSAAASTSSTTAAASTSTNTAINSTATTSTTTSSLGAIRGTQNRFGDRQTATASASQTTATGTTTAAASSTALGSNGLGTTSSGLIGSGGTGGPASTPGGSDFALVLTRIAEPGSHVKKGEVVAEFDPQYQLNRLDDYKATVLQLDANIKKMHSDLVTAKKAHDQLVESAKGDWDKALLDLKTAEVRSAIEAEDLKLAVRETEARYKQVVEEAKLLDASQHADILASEIERNQAKLELDRATVNLDRMVVRAPMDGIAVMQQIWRGGDFGQVQKGDQIWPGQTFMQIVDPASMVLAADLNQVDTESLQLGRRAVARLDAYPGSEFPAKVVGIGAMTKPAFWRPNFMREIPVRLKLEQVDARVIPDLSASADILLTLEKQATIVPLSAIFQDGDAKPFVFLRTGATWERREIETGMRNRIAAVVRSGVSPGDVVATERPASGKAPS
jgi:biotin carboxyl carrier protein